MMKRIVLAIVMVVMFTVTYGQNKWQQNKINYFVEEASKEFNLDKGQQKQLLEARTSYIVEFASISKKVKSGVITAEQKKNEVNTINKKFNTVLMELTGKKNKELQPFLKKMREELKAVK